MNRGKTPCLGRDRNATAAVRGDPRRGGEDAVEIEGIRCAKGERGAGRALTGRSQELDGFRQGVLLAGEAGDEPASTNLAAQLQVSARSCEVSPWDGHPLALEQ